MYEVLLDPHAERDLDRLDDQTCSRLLDAIERLARAPRRPGIRKLNKDTYRLRVGSFRVIYVVHDEERVVLISRVRRRGKGTYRGI